MFGSEIPWTFKTWLANFKGVDLPIGDLAEDVLSDPNFLDDDEWEFFDMAEHINQKSHNSVAVMDAFLAAWEFYLRTRR